MKYTHDITTKLILDYSNGDGRSVAELAAELEVLPRSIIAKLSSLGVYKRKEYLDKRGETPVKKEVYIDRIAQKLTIPVELLESLEKVTKSALVLMDARITDLID
jgi:hypothetical protein